MAKSSVFEILLQAVKKQQAEVEKIRPNAKLGSGNESKLEEAYNLFNAVVIALLKAGLDQVSIQRDPKKGHEHLLVVLATDGFKFRFPASIIADDRELSQKVKQKMENVQIRNGRVMSYSNPAQPMSWDEFLSLPYGIRHDLEKEIERVWAPADWLALAHLRKAGLPLEQVTVLEGALPDNYRAAAMKLLSEFRIPQDYPPKELMEVWREELAKIIELRRATQVAVEVRLRMGSTQYGRFSYGIDVIAPDGREFSVINSGCIYDGRWEGGNCGRWHRTVFEGPGQYVKSKMYTPEFIPFMGGIPVFNERGFQKSTQEFLKLDFVSQPNEDGCWVWLVYLPSKEWKVRGGSTTFMDSPLNRKASVRNLD